MLLDGVAGVVKLNVPVVALPWFSPLINPLTVPLRAGTDEPYVMLAAFAV